MSSTMIVPYDPMAAIEHARSVAEMRLGQVQAELEEEFALALALAGEYAAHLATGGDPTDYPKPEDRGQLQRGIARVAREAVFDAWNVSRERQSLSYPWGQGMPYRWLVHEYLLDRLGQPVPIAPLAVLNRHRIGKQSPQSVAEAAWSLQVATAGAVRVRKVRADGKVAWLARSPIIGDDLADLVWREGVWASSLDRMTDLERQAALGRPFKHHVREYPTEALR